MNPRQTFIRAFPTHLEKTGPRQLTGRFVPYGEVTNVADELLDKPGEFDLYQEGFRPGAFGPQVNTKAPKVLNRIGLVHKHEGGLGYLGPVIALREQPDGLYGDIMIVRSKADDVEDLLQAGVDELSIEFRLPVKGINTEIDDKGVRWRTRAHLDGVALEPKGAYSTARVLQYRADKDAEAAAQAEEERLKAEEKAAEEKAEADKAAALKETEERAEREVAALLSRREKFAEFNKRLEREQLKQKELRREYMPADIRNK